MLREKIKQELYKLNEQPREKLADFIAFIEFQTKQVSYAGAFWQEVTPEARTKEFREWVSQLPQTGLSLPDEAFDRDSIYEE